MPTVVDHWKARLAGIMRIVGNRRGGIGDSEGRRRTLVASFGCLVLALFAVFGAFTSTASAAPLVPMYDGILAFPTIKGPLDPEEFSWEVELPENQRLELIDEQHAEIFFKESDHYAGEIVAEPAHDAGGATVATSLSVTQPNIVTLIVRHRSGNPAAGGAPFAYPIMPGKGWELTGPPQIVTGPKDETELREEHERELRQAGEDRERDDGLKQKEGPGTVKILQWCPTGPNQPCRPIWRMSRPDVESFLMRKYQAQTVSCSGQPGIPNSHRWRCEVSTKARDGTLFVRINRSSSFLKIDGHGASCVCSRRQWSPVTQVAIAGEGVIRV